MTAPLAPLLSSWRAASLPDLASTWAVGAPGRAFGIAGLFESLDRTLLVVIPGDGEAEELVDDLRLFTDRVSLAPAWETLPFEHVSPNTATMALRSQARVALAGDQPVVVVASIRSAVQRLSASDPSPVLLAKGEEVDLVGLSRSLASLGYHRTERVEARGEFAVRGGIVDVFPAQEDHPMRLDFVGDTLNELRRFSVARPNDPRLRLTSLLPTRPEKCGPVLEK